MSPHYLLLFFALFHFSALGQHFTHGPIVGAVTDTSARIYIRTSAEADVRLEIHPTAKPQLSKTYYFKTIPRCDTSSIQTIDGLHTDHYSYVLTLPSTQEIRCGTFKTFPSSSQKTNLRLAFGSCLEQLLGDTIFEEIAKAKPDIFIELGDWTYPDHEGYPFDIPGGKNHFYSTAYQKVQEAYRIRYSLPHLPALLSSTPIDFIHDDDDFAFDGNSRYTHSDSKWINGRIILSEDTLPEKARENAILGNLENFPHYPMGGSPDEGLYHKWRYGNVEVFFLDSRANRSPDNEAFIVKNGRIKFHPPAHHSILGQKQMNWLLDGLKSSSADWKIVASGTNFNCGYKQVMDIAVAMQGVKLEGGRSGGGLASSMASMWVGFPHDQHKLINFIADNKIPNVVMISGDSHNSAIDDGKNGGLPELMSGNLGVPNSRICDAVYNKMGIDIWNGGGQGIRNLNFNNCFGQLDFFKSDSLKLSIIDQKGSLVASSTLKAGFVPQKVKLKPMIGHTVGTRFRLYWNLLKIVGKLLTKR
jgi:alkaline phosphatase D